MYPISIFSMINIIRNENKTASDVIGLAISLLILVKILLNFKEFISVFCCYSYISYSYKNINDFGK